MKNEKGKYDYGRCHTCGERMKEKRIKQDLWVKGKLIVIENVPAGVCPQCGEKVVKAEIGQRIASLVEPRTRLRTARTLTVPVIRFTKAVA